jgi:hypothetical protein
MVPLILPHPVYPSIFKRNNFFNAIQVSYQLFASTILAPFIFFGVKSSTTSQSEILDRVTFEAITGGSSVFVCAYYFLSSLKDHVHSSQPTFSQVQETNLSDCRIPSKFFLFLILPIVTTTAGTSFSRAKWLTVINMSLYFGMIAMMYRGIMTGCDDQCFHKDIGDKLVNLANDAITGVLMVTVSYFACLPGAEIGNKYITSLYAGMEADNILNHVIKVGWAKRFNFECLLITLSLIAVNRIPSRVRLLPLSSSNMYLQHPKNRPMNITHSFRTRSRNCIARCDGAQAGK